MQILTTDKDHFAELAVSAVLRLKGSTNLEAIQIIKKTGGTLRVSHGGPRVSHGGPAGSHEGVPLGCRGSVGVWVWV